MPLIDLRSEKIHVFHVKKNVKMRKCPRCENVHDFVHNFQEVKFSGYHTYWAHAENKAGYSGVG